MMKTMREQQLKSRAAAAAPVLPPRHEVAPPDEPLWSVMDATTTARGLIAPEAPLAERLSLDIQVDLAGHRVQPEDALDSLRAAEGLLELEKNWDGEHAEPLDHEVVSQVLGFLKNMRSPWLPDVLPNVDGGVRLEWWAPSDRTLTVDFRRGGRVDVCAESATTVLIWENGDDVPNADLGPWLLRVMAQH